MNFCEKKKKKISATGGHSLMGDTVGEQHGRRLHFSGRGDYRERLLHRVRMFRVAKKGNCLK